LNEKLKDSSSREADLKSKLKDAKDHAELLEFRLLEVEEVVKVWFFP